MRGIASAISYHLTVPFAYSSAFILLTCSSDSTGLYVRSISDHPVGSLFVFTLSESRLVRHCLRVFYGNEVYGPGDDCAGGASSRG